MRGLAKRIIGVIILVAALFFPLPSPLSDMNVKILLIFVGISFIGFEIFFNKRNIVAMILFFSAISGLVPIDLPLKIITFIIALDLIHFPVIPEIPIISSFIDISKIVGRIFLVILFIALNNIGFGKLGIDFIQLIFIVGALTIGEIALKFISFGIIPWKAIAIFIIAYFWVFNHNWMFSLIPAAADFVLDKIL